MRFSTISFTAVIISSPDDGNVSKVTEIIIQGREEPQDFSIHPFSNPLPWFPLPLALARPVDFPSLGFEATPRRG